MEYEGWEFINSIKKVSKATIDNELEKCAEKHGCEVCPMYKKCWDRYSEIFCDKDMYLARYKVTTKTYSRKRGRLEI